MRRAIWILLGIVLAGTYVGSFVIQLIVDYYWFDATGYPQVYRTVVLSKVAIGAVSLTVAFAILLLNLRFATSQLGDPRRYLPPEMLTTPLGRAVNARTLGWLAVAASAVLALLTVPGPWVHWELVLLYLDAVPFGHSDPIFERDAGFYVFTLPFYGLVQSFLASTAFIALLASGALYYLHFRVARATTYSDDLAALAAMPRGHLIHLATIGAALLLLLAVDLYLERFALMHRPGGLFTGPGYADLNGTLPVLALKAVTAAVVAVGLVLAVAGRRWRLLVGLVLVAVVVWAGGSLYAYFLQRFLVSPNELERERPFLELHITATNRAFALDRVTERHLEEEAGLTMADIEANQATVTNVRLWDHEPLLDTFAQIQEIRTYYDFVAVDNDRYRLGGELRQTMLSPRELNTESLPSRTWVNERLTFTHGYGLTVGPVNRVNEQGLPVLYVQDLPPRSTAPELEVTRPKIYYGEVTKGYVFVNTRQQEFNYPEGDRNIFSTYAGEGGIRLDSLWKRLLLSAYTRDLKMLLSDDFTDDTRVLIYRHIHERIRKVAPFLAFDRDPYMIIDEGKLYWILDAYTVSDRFPYSEHVNPLANYMRNPVKAVIDAYDGSVSFYLVDPDEPIALAWAAVFPEMFRPIGELRPSIREHLRHPVDFFNVQAQMYATYHMLDVNTFYNKEDQWSVPEVGDLRMEPYFTVMRLPEEARAEFILMLPFTPRLKDNLAAWMVARNDGDLLGQLVVYVFPKQRLIYGPKQMVGRINQDPVVSQQITLWDRAGSNVIRGTLLVIPIEQSLIYIQPLYLRAEDGRIPELKRVIVGYGNDIAMGVDLEDALQRIFTTAAARPSPSPGSVSSPISSSVRGPRPGEVATGDPAVAPSAAGAPTPAARALRHYDAMREAAAAGDWSTFGRELGALGQALRELER